MRSLSIMGIAWALLSGCGPRDDEEPTDEVAPPDASCVGDVLEAGDPQGHPDVFGAKAAGQARAARLTDAGEVPQPAHGRQGIEDGDFVLANEHIAVVIEDGGLSDGYGRFGGEILAVDVVGEDGRPAGHSYFVETLIALGLAMPDPTSVGVLRDGSDGGEAIVRVIGTTEPLPFLDGPLTDLAASAPSLRVAYDYVLAPGERQLVVRLSVVNESEEPLDLGEIKVGSDELFGFFQTNHNQLVTAEHGFDARGELGWLGFVNDGPAGFAWRSLAGDLLFGIDVSGFSFVNGPGLLAEGCAITTSDRVAIIVGGPHYDGLREAVRQADGTAPWREITGQVVDADGVPITDAWVHEVDAAEQYLSRTRTGPDGRFTLHAPDETVVLTAQAPGHVHEGVEVGVDLDAQTLTLQPHGLLHVAAESLQGTALPVRVQVIPTDEPDSPPNHWGVLDEKRGRLHQAFVMDGDVTLVVPPGEHRVVVSRGYEWELHDVTVDVAAGQTTEVAAVLEHSVDSTGVMCADFHIHSHMSADSDDPIDDKVRSAIADGLDIPVSSEHEWVVDFGPVIERLGLADWAYGMPSSELTTFSFGHFGVVPTLPDPGGYNQGAVDWVGLDPAGVFDRIDARPEQPAVIVNHPSNAGFGGYFSSVMLDSRTGLAGVPELWSPNFDAVEVFNDSTLDENRDASVADWFSLLNLGMRVSAVGSSDSHHIRSSPVGYPRTCFPLGTDDPRALSHDLVRDAVIDGIGTVSGGLLMTVVGPQGAGPGDSLSPGTASFEVTVQGPSWIEASELEVVVSGETRSVTLLEATGPGPANRYVETVELTVQRGDWVVFHARGADDLSPLHPDRVPFAVSNPIFIE